MSRRFDGAALIGSLAFVALLLYGLIHAYWAFGGDGLPFGADDANPEYSAFEHVGRDRLAPWIAGGFLGSAAIALLLSLPGRRRIPAPVLVGASVFSAAAVFCTLADFRILGNLAYVFMLKFSAINWTVIDQLFAVVSVGLMLASAIIYQRRTLGACTGCGRTDSGAGWTSPESAARWGKWAKENGKEKDQDGGEAEGGQDAGSGGGSASGGGSSGGDGAAESGGDTARGGTGSSGSGGSGGAAKPPAPDPGPAAPDGRVPQHFVGTWAIASQYDALQPHTVVVRRVSPGQSAVTLVADVQGSGHCEYTAKLTSVADGGQRINVGTAVVDQARSTGMCRDTDPSFFAVAGSGIQHDVGPAHGSGYRYNRA
ncbi:DUF3995 domain-containing protein [Streptomyces sp. NPDC054874]